MKYKEKPLGLFLFLDWGGGGGGGRGMEFLNVQFLGVHEQSRDSSSQNGQGQSSFHGFLVMGSVET